MVFADSEDGALLEAAVRSVREDEFVDTATVERHYRAVIRGRVEAQRKERLAIQSAKNAAEHEAERPPLPESVVDQLAAFRARSAKGGASSIGDLLGAAIGGIGADA